MAEHAEASYPQVEQRPNYPELEEKILAFWREDGTFEASVEQRPASNEFVFYDGPPFANGLPHYGHLLTGFVKDVVPRYQTMRGRRVERRFGWDCHGLPAETAAEQELDVAGHVAITAFGVDRFNARCREIVQRTTDAWERYVTRQARWVDFQNDYKTMDLSFMESVIWAIARLHEKGLLYEGYRVLPYCWECETPLSNFETRQDDAHRDRTDPAVTVMFDLEAAPGASGPAAGSMRVLVWTTTPWTLPSNLALAVGPDLEYAVLERGDERFLVGAERVEHYGAELEGADQIGTVRGAELIGRRYRPLFAYFAEHPGAFVVLGADFVSLEEGTGVVHLAPGFGEDDQRVCEGAGIAVVAPVDERGRFLPPVGDLAGVHVFAANTPITERLAAEGALLRVEDYVHSYPHCWRTDTPLIYRAMTSWFVEVTAVKDRLVELNRTIDWVPEHVRDGSFGNWLEGARDWSISRNRFWGTPIPVWRSDDPAYPRIDVYGSLDELARDFGTRPVDLHRPAVDALVRPNPDDPTGRSMMRRVPDVLDCWFESGSMPFAQLHYPFENAERFSAHFPADFVVEYVGQTRGWFYTMHVLATALFDCPAFEHCIAHGIVLGNDGRKLSKRLQNYPDPEEVFSTLGADAMRWYLCSSPVLRGQDVVIESAAMAEPIRQVLNPIWNAWYFLALYGAADGVRGRVRTDQPGLLDRYALAKLAVLVGEVTARLDAYDLPGATSAITGFLDALNNWYIRRSRDRFWRGRDAGRDDGDKADAYDTLHTVLEVLCRIVAPLLPLLADTIYRDLTGARSVHLADWPDAALLPADPDLVAAMDLVRDVSSSAHSIRKANGRQTRQPLARLVVAAEGAGALEPFIGLIADEVNVKIVELSEDAVGRAKTTLAVVPGTLGPRLGARTQQVIAAVKRGEWTRTPDGRVEVAGVVLEEGEYSLRLEPTDQTASRILPGDLGVVWLDLELTAELEGEGTAREVARLVQQARKDAGLQITDRIRLTIAGPADLLETLGAHRDQISAQVLALGIALVPPEEVRRDQATFTADYTLPDGRRFIVSFVRVVPGDG